MIDEELKALDRITYTCTLLAYHQDPTVKQAMNEIYKAASVIRERLHGIPLEIKHA